jgi:hypothetical protein
MNDTTLIAQMITEQVKGQLMTSEGQISLTAIEQTTQQVLHELGRQVVEAVTQGMATSYPSDSSECSCGQAAVYVRQRATRLYTLFGQLWVKRAYYLCDHCHQGHYPLDQQLGLRPNGLSAELARLVAMTGVQLPYGKGSALFEALTRVKVSDPCMAKATGKIGEVVMAREKQLLAQATDLGYLSQRARQQQKPLRFYGAIDATKVHVCEDGVYQWRDLKVGSWFEARGQPPTSPSGQWQIRAENIHYFADISPAAEFGSLFWATGVAHKADLAHELIILGDGAEWIWNLVQENFPHAIQILDWFHASEHLMPLAQAAFTTAVEQNNWVTMAKQLMWNGKIDELLAACRQLQEHCQADVIRTTINYFHQHRHRLRYAYFRKQGYQIGSGTIESAAKQIGLLRMKVAGATWNTQTARKVAKARAAYLSDCWANLSLAV